MHVIQDLMELLQHFSHPAHPLVFNQDDRRGYRCWGCRELVLGPSYSCVECGGRYLLHKSCAELSLGLHHPLHPIHPLILVEQRGACEICKKYHREYTYSCYRCDFNLHITCASLLPTLEAEFHDHPLTPLWKWITFTCDLCGIKEDKGMPYLCNPCGFSIHRKCAYFPSRIKVVRHKHPLHITHSSLELHESNSQFCLLCIQKVDTRNGFYSCSECNFVTHLNCALYSGNREVIDLQELKKEENTDVELNDLEPAYKVKNIKVGEDGTKIATEIEHFSHKHELKLIDEEGHNNEKCDGCVRAILSPFYSCADCSFFLHKSCIELPRKKRSPLHQHVITLLPNAPSSKLFKCDGCGQSCNGFVYTCQECDMFTDLQCNLLSDTFMNLTLKGHKHPLFFSSVPRDQKCNCCDRKNFHVLRCTTCEFAVDFKCATLPETTRYKQHEHTFTLHYTTEDDSNEYYCDICEEERNPNYWFYYCEDCSYPAHPECILGKYPNLKFGGIYKFDCHQHPLTFIEEIGDDPPCHKCGSPCKELIYQCVRCNFHIHSKCV